MPRALLAALLLVLPGPATAAEAGLAMQVPAGESKSIRLRNLPLGAVLMVRVVASGKLPVALVSARQLKSPKPNALFRAIIDRKLSFKVVIPEGDDYFIVLNNRRGSEALDVETEIRAERGRAKPPAPDYSPRPEKARRSPSESSMLSSDRRILEFAASARCCASQ
jgi:hypothetical protein